MEFRAKRTTEFNVITSIHVIVMYSYTDIFGYYFLIYSFNSNISSFTVGIDLSIVHIKTVHKLSSWSNNSSVPLCRDKHNLTVDYCAVRVIRIILLILLYCCYRADLIYKLEDITYCGKGILQRSYPESDWNPSDYANERRIFGQVKLRYILWTHSSQRLKF